MRKPDAEQIVLQASGSKKIWLVCASVLILVLGVLLTLANGIQSGAYCFFTLILVIIGGLVDTSKGSNIVLTGKSICGGKIFRKSTDWDRLGKVWMAQYDLVWKGRNAKGGKPYTCKTAYGPFGRECQHNQRHVSIDLAIEWIEALRDASSETERRELIRKFRGSAPRSLSAIDSLSPEEQAKANKLLKELNSFSIGSRYRKERKMEIRQYFANKGWEIPPTTPSALMEVFFYFYVFILIPGCLFVIFYILFKYCLA